MLITKSISQKNHLLAALPTEVLKRVLANIELVRLDLGQVLYKPNEKQSYAFFPVDTIVSLLYVMEDGKMAEMAIVGNDGIVGTTLFMGGESSCNWAVVQSAGYAYRIKKDLIASEFNMHGEFLHLMLRYTQSLISQTAQTAVCNSHHSIDQRLCRWLLMSLDRVPNNSLTITHELIANSLGVRREGVTNAARKLQKLAAIEYGRGLIKVLDRAKIEELSCECYAVVKKETDRLNFP